VNRALAVVAVVAALSGSSAAAEAPLWLRQAAAAPSAPTDAAAVVVHDDIDVVVTDDGRVKTTRRYAARIRSGEGREAAALRQVYLNPSGKVRAVRGWVIRAGGGVRELAGADVVDVAAVNNDVFNEVRVRAIAAGDDIAGGDVFGAEIEAEERLLFAQLEWPLQERWPVRLARRSLRLPPGWRASSVTFNATALQARSEGAALVWEARDMPEIPYERSMPPISALVPRLAVSFFGTEASPAPGQFESWAQVADWLHALSDAAGRPSADLARKARELTAQSATSFDRIRAIGRFVQRIQYVSVQTGLGRGGGYQPRPADVVLARNYGDCKDKANLMRALLAAVDIKGYLVSIYSGDRDYVRMDWPSPQQFNHAIIAVVADDAPPGAPVLPHGSLGNLLLFDPTDEHTPVGELPVDEQGSLALIVTRGGSLERMPVTKSGRGRAVQAIDMAVDPGGAIVARVRETLHGEYASAGRAMRQTLDPAEYRGMIERRTAAFVPGGRVTRIEPDAGDEAAFGLSLEIRSATYAQPTGNLLIFKPPFEPDERFLAAGGSQRRHPIVLEGGVTETDLRIVLPQGLHVDELPAAVSLDGPFGRYSLTYSAAAGVVTARRVLEMPAKTVPAADHAALRGFLEKARAADQSPIVLVKR
jgi:hypothetical protein